MVETGNWGLCNLVVGVVGGDVVGNVLPRRIHRLSVFLHFLKVGEWSWRLCLELCDFFYVVDDCVERVFVLRLGEILFVRRNVFPSRFLL